MKSPLVLALFVAGCSANDSQPPSWSFTLEPPTGIADVFAAVKAMPECDVVREEGGEIHWRAGDFICEGTGILASGCSFPYERPPRIEVVYRGSAWDSSLPHELCHVCGYLDETEAEMCAYRVKRARPPETPAEGGSP